VFLCSYESYSVDFYFPYNFIYYSELKSNDYEEPDENDFIIYSLFGDIAACIYNPFILFSSP
jgi:hypothetical protein